MKSNKTEQPLSRVLLADKGLESLDLRKLSYRVRKDLADAFACAVTGHPIKWKTKTAQRIWKKYVVKNNT